MDVGQVPNWGCSGRGSKTTQNIIKPVSFDRSKLHDILNASGPNYIVINFYLTVVLKIFFHILKNDLYQNQLYCTTFISHKRFLLIMLFEGLYMHSHLSDPNYINFPY
jgi:hypothetical protein